MLTIVDDGTPPVLASVAVSATGGQFSPDPAPVGTWVQVTLSARATRPTPGSEYTVSAPNWAWSLLNGQYTCPPIVTALTTGTNVTDYSYMFVPATPPASDATYDYSAVTLWANFTTPGIWQMNANAQVDYTDNGGGTHEGAAQAPGNGTEWDVDKILRKRDGATKYVPLDEGVTKYALPGSLIDVQPRIVPDTVTATSYLWDTPPTKAFKDYVMNNSEGKLTPFPNGDLKNDVLKFYWADAGTKTVNCTVTVVVNGVKEVKSRSGDLVVDQPTVDPPFKAFQGRVDWRNATSFGLLKGPDTSIAGMEFVATVNVPSGYAQGTWEFVQMITPARASFGPGPRYWNQNGISVLDTAVPYPFGRGDKPAGQFQTASPGTAFDSPFTTLAKGVLLQSVNKEQFKMYIMFKPGGDNSKWVPLQYWGWWWQGTARLKGQTYSLTKKDQDMDVSATNTTAHPMWSANFKDGHWAPVVLFP